MIAPHAGLPVALGGSDVVGGAGGTAEGVPAPPSVAHAEHLCRKIMQKYYKIDFKKVMQLE